MQCNRSQISGIKKSEVVENIANWKDNAKSIKTWIDNDEFQKLKTRSSFIAENQNNESEAFHANKNQVNQLHNQICHFFLRFFFHFTLIKFLYINSFALTVGK